MLTVMHNRDVPVRAIALALLLGFPATAGARQAIDSLGATATRGQVESQHASGCAWNHDHRVCLLAHQAAWPSADSSPATQPGPARPDELGLSPETFPPRSTTLALGPRAPPHID